MLKKSVLLLLVICVSLCLPACGTTQTGGNPIDTPSETQPSIVEDDANVFGEGSNQTSFDIEETNQTAHVHSYSDATCTSPKKCSCGATAGTALGHQFLAATCTSPQICSRCGSTNGSELGHDYSAADCNSPKTCTRCGQTEGSALGHDYVNDKCSRCGKADPDSLPVSLNELHVIDATYKCGYYDGSLTDSFGNGYVGGYRLHTSANPGCAIFNLNYKYSTFSCSIITNCEDASFSIYVDNVLKYQTTNLSKLDGPLPIEIDVKNGQQLKVIANDNTYSYSEAGYLVDAQLIK